MSFHSLHPSRSPCQRCQRSWLFLSPPFARSLLTVIYPPLVKFSSRKSSLSFIPLTETRKTTKQTPARNRTPESKTTPQVPSFFFPARPFCTPRDNSHFKNPRKDAQHRSSRNLRPWWPRRNCRRLDFAGRWVISLVGFFRVRRRRDSSSPPPGTNDPH